MVKKMPAPGLINAKVPAQNNSKATNQQEASSKFTPQDKDNIKNILDMMGDRFERSYIQKVYLMNNKEFERTLDMFLTDNLPEVDAKPQLTIIETAPNQSSMINTSNSNSNFVQGSGVNQVDMRSYVLDQYKEALCPRKLNKYELAHNEAMERQKIREKEE